MNFVLVRFSQILSGIDRSAAVVIGAVRSLSRAFAKSFM